MTAIERDASAPGKLPLFVIAGSHGSLHWAVATFYLLLPFIKTEFGLDYTQTGFLVTIVHLSAFAANIPAGVVVDVTGRRLACQLFALIVCAAGLAGLGWAREYWLLAFFVALISMMNTLWHPAAISFLSESYANRRGLALSFHTVGASLGDAAAPAAAGVLITAIGWHETAMIGAVVPLAAALLLFILSNSGPGAQRGESGGGVRDYLAGLSLLLRDAEVWKVCIMAGFRGTSQTGLRTFLPLYLAAAFAVNAFWIGVALMVLQLSGAVATPFAGGISDKVGRRPVLFAGFAVSLIVICALPLTDSLAFFIVLVGLAGIATFAVRPVIQSWALEKAPARLGGSMVSFLFGMQSAFAMAVPVLGGLIADIWGIEYVFYALGSTIVVAMVIAATISEQR